MKGTLVNAAAIAAGGILGMILKKGFVRNLGEAVNKALGAAVLVVGLNGVVANMMKIAGGKLESSGELLLIVSLVVGTALGEVLKLDDRLQSFSAWVEGKFSVSEFAKGFTSATVLFCVGAMAVIGSLNDGLTGDAAVLYVKSTLDFVSAVVLGASLGVGVIFSAVPTLIYQGAISLGAGFFAGVLTGDLLTQICFVGYAVILCIGINFLWPGKFKVLNMLPAVLVPPLWALIGPPLVRVWQNLF